MLYEDLTKKIIGCAIEVHKRLGNGFQEVIYQRALEIELELSGIKFLREFRIPFFIKADKLLQERLIFS